MAKHCELAIGDGSFSWQRRTGAIAAVAALDGLYVIRTSVGSERLDAPSVVSAYRSLTGAQRAFRSLQTIDLEGRPVFHWRADRVRAHRVLCLLAAYVTWHLRAALAPVLFAEEEPPARPDPVAPPVRSSRARRKDARHRTADVAVAVGSFRTLLAHVATLTEKHRSQRPDEIDLGSRSAEVRPNGRVWQAEAVRRRLVFDPHGVLIVNRGS